MDCMSTLSNYVTFEPVKLSAALGAFGIALAGLLALVISAPIGLAVGGVWTAGVGIFNVLFVRNQVTPTASVPGIVHDTIVALAPLAKDSRG